MPEPDDGLGHYLEDVEGALSMAVLVGRVPPARDWVDAVRTARVEEALGSMM